MTQTEFLNTMAVYLTRFFRISITYSKSDTKVITYLDPQPDGRQHLLMHVLHTPKGELTASLWFSGESTREFPDHWADRQARVAAREIMRLKLATRTNPSIRIAA